MSDIAEGHLDRTLASPVRPAAARGRQWWLLALVAIVVLAADQLSKHLVRTHLQMGESWPSSGWFVHISHVTNTGAAFGILQDQTVFLVVTSLIGLGAIVLYYLYPPFHHPVLRVAFGMQLGGAIGNLSDRVRLGSVTDFIKFPHYPYFNVADSCIVVGVCVLAWFLVFRDGRDGEQQREQR
ncbi:MAG TPA: signal peptidase II [Dehalococcoidia bacterium]|nr:signal peptidase II [Dehalococcoidia bacterium]